MSSRSTAIDTAREHWFYDCNPEIVDGEPMYDVLTIHIDDSSILRWEKDEDSLVIDIRPDSELYKVLREKLMRR